MVREQEGKFIDGCVPQEQHCHQNVQTPAAFKSFQMLLLCASFELQ
jgi:hypothetical protein